MNKRIFIGCSIAVLALSGCQSNSLDRAMNMKEAFNMTFCDSDGFTSYHPAKMQGDTVNFRCKNGLSVALPSQTVFESDEGYVSKYYDELLMAKAISCPDNEDSVHTFLIQSNKSGIKYHIGCSLSGRSDIETGLLRNTLEDQYESIQSLESYCETNETYKFIWVKKRSSTNTLKFQCNDRAFTVTDDINQDDIEDLNALFCDYSGITSINAKVINKLTNQRQAEFKCQNGFNSTVQF
ncbi:hypothetical protein RND59_15070 [Vibrio ruber]|uniref:hypothetical protein n=1 Tax=Vibrio ruber TaxID=184755 RepID=UPI0028932D48|nr:hypothetical protein [Vibrio ruber]WNJ95424.1 hypothetical protein RND59_15070 [Vibrio ruber]